jgi:hypothetical protein
MKDKKIVYPKKPKKGDFVICKDDDSENEDFGMSGIVFPGRKDLQVGKKYEIDRLPWDADRNVPNNERKTWTKEEFQMVRWGWYEVYLKGIGSSVFLHNFEPVK